MNLLGIEIYDNTLRLFDNKKPGGICYTVPLAPHSVSDGRLQDIPLFVQTLQAQLKVHGIKTKNAYLVLKTSQCIFRFTTFPNLPVKDLRKAILQNAKDHFPFSLQEYAVDFIASPASSGQMDVLLAALPQDLVLPYLSAAEQATLCLHKVCLFQEAVSASLRDHSIRPVVVLTEYPERVNVMTLEKGEIRFMGDLIFSKDIDLQRDLIHMLGVSRWEQMGALYVFGTSLRAQALLLQTSCMSVFLYPENGLSDMALKGVYHG